MNPRYRLWAIILLLILPSAAYVWTESDVPRFCAIHDDGLYFVSAKSLADGGGYRIASLPGEPPQTKYPPLYPLLLSVVWRVAPQFPANLTPAVWLSWLAVPALLILLVHLYRRLGFEGWRCIAPVALIAICSDTISFGANLLTEVPFTAMFVGVMVLVERSLEERDGRKWSGAAGLLMGLAYLTRSAGIVALATMPLYYLLRRKPKLGLLFAGAMLPFVLGWMSWVKLHQVPASDPTLMYYVDYAGYQLYNVKWNDLPVLLWKNTVAFVWSLGAFIVPRVTATGYLSQGTAGANLKVVTVLVGIANLCGIVRMGRRGLGLSYILYALASAAILIVWHFPPDPRLAYPLAPLAIAGFWTLAEDSGRVLLARSRDRAWDQRIAAWGLLGTGVAALAAAVVMQGYMYFEHLPTEAHEYRTRRNVQLEAFAWIRDNTPASTPILATRDPLFFLATGRHAMNRVVEPKHWYHEDREAFLDAFRQIVPFAQEHKLPFVYYAGADFGWLITKEESQEIDRLVASNPNLVPIFHQGKATLYSVDPATVVATAH